MVSILGVGGIGAAAADRERGVPKGGGAGGAAGGRDPVRLLHSERQRSGIQKHKNNPR